MAPLRITPIRPILGIVPDRRFAVVEAPRLDRVAIDHHEFVVHDLVAPVEPDRSARAAQDWDLRVPVFRGLEVGDDPHLDAAMSGVLQFF